MDSLTIREVIDTVLRGQIRIPAFQRGFVWEPDRVAYLMDSIYKQYPFGSLLFWRTKEQLKSERELGPFDLPAPTADYPIDYVLDGQQRITSIFGVFQNELPIARPELWRDVYFDLGATSNAQETQFCALLPTEVIEGRHFPLKTLFDTTAYRKATAAFDEVTAKRVDDMQSVFKEMRVPLQMFRTEEKAAVAIIFERVNRQGVPLDTLQLLSAWTWSEEFQLQSQFEELAEQLAPFGFKDVGVDANLLLRCCSAILHGDASPDSLMKLNGGQVRQRFVEVTNGVKGAVDYLRTNCNVHALGYIPFAAILVPLSVFFAVPGDQEVKYSDDQRRTIDRWFWRTAFSKRYANAVLRNLNTDIEEMKKLKEGKPSALGGFAVSIQESFFIENGFTMGTANTNTFVLLLAKQSPRSFVSGAAIDLGEKLRRSNRAEFHHLMPKAFVEASKQAKAASPNCLANFAFISRADNRQLGGEAPSVYRAKMPTDVAPILAGAVCPPSLFADKYGPFIVERAKLLRAAAEDLCK
ncbi:DUF262 domain-containing protein [Sorangium sp. So ce185]|uniref:GmrSD restriction endonuclease domain-containing protein n=1 Tax=Sorangium sp. So ce185 TaxID=3133287 RepID=UPI003F62F374